MDKKFEKKNDPTFAAGDIDLKTGAVIVLKSAKPVASGTKSFASGETGKWNLWPIVCSDAVVQDRVTKAKTKGYTGDSCIFPSEKLNEQFLAITGGTKEGCTVKVEIVPVKGEKGFYTTYVATLIGEGQTFSDALQPSQLKYIEDFKKYVAGKVIANDKDSFFAMGANSYGLTASTLEKLWNVYKE